MLSRNKLLKFSAKAKSLGIIDTLTRYHPVYYKAAIKTISSFKHADLETRVALARKLRTKTLEQAQRTDYGRQYGSEYASYPILTKAALRDDINQFISSRLVSIPASTGGTTGLPLKLSRSLESVASEQAFIDDLIQPFNLDFRTSRIAVLRANEIKSPTDNCPPYGVFSHAGRRLTLSNSHLSQSTIKWFVNALEEFQPDLFWVYPSMIANFVRLIEEAHLNLTIPYVLCSSESLGTELFLAIKQTLSSSVIDYYGQGERVCFASSTKPNEYWFNPAYGNVELRIDEQGKTERGNITAKIISTSFWNSAMPFIRYDTGDIAVLPHGTSTQDCESITLGLMPFLGIGGRSNEFITTEDGRSIGGLNHLPREVDYILRLQVVQETYRKIVIRVLAQSGFSNKEIAKLSHNARLLIPEDINIDIIVVDSLEVAPNGKTPFVVRHV